MQDVTQYLYDLRRKKHISRAALAGQVGSTEMSIYRIEEKGQEPGGELLLRMMHALEADYEEVRARLLDTERQSRQPTVEELVAEIERADLEQYEEIMRRLTGLFGWKKKQERPAG